MYIQTIQFVLNIKCYNKFTISNLLNNNKLIKIKFFFFTIFIAFLITNTYYFNSMPKYKYTMTKLIFNNGRI